MTAAPHAKRLSGALGLAFLAFVSLGLPDGVLGVAWPSIRDAFGLPLDALGALLVTATAGYVTSSFASGWLLARMRLGTLLALSCALTATGLLGYAAAPAWAAMVALGAAAGLGAGAIDAGLNSWVAAHHGPRTLNLLHASYGLGTTLGPVVMTGVLASGASWRRGYAILGVAQLALAATFLASRRRWIGGAAGAAIGPAAVVRPTPAATLRLRSARLGIVSFFLYTGVEAAAGAWIYSLLHQARGVEMAAAGGAVSIYWGGLLGGRLWFGLVPERLHPRALPTKAATAAALAATLLALAPSGPTSLAAAGLLGIACGPIFPSLIAATPRRLGAEHAANGVGFQVAAAALGQSLLPATAGLIAGRVGLEIVPWVLAVAALGLSVLLRAAERGAEERSAAPSLGSAAIATPPPPD